MPEGHTLHRLAQRIDDAFAGDRVSSSSPQGRFEEGAARIDGLTLVSADAWGKHLLVRFDGLAEQVHVHLGLFGKFRVRKHPEGEVPEVTGQVRWRLVGPAEWPTRTGDLRGPTACTLLLPDEVDTLLSRLGPDPLREDADPGRAWARIHRSRAPIATLLMDQSVVAGVGNVYRAEVLFRNGVDPFLPGRELPEPFWDAMWADLVALMREGVRQGRIDTVHVEHGPDVMGRAPRQDDHGGEVYVYRRDGRACYVCGDTVRKQELAARNLFWCSTCQRAGTLGR
ncbi:MAG: Fpg/Nei family DNA glycosylase [Propionibacteriales bacterium]|nr:Fpg/Nei family DNA glycosylase [Propionibacteriales bacterium]